jgi:quinol-cytochrome oxidoreductase complex cytochrome b subunit
LPFNSPKYNIFSLQRTPKQAVGFYATYLVLVFVLGGVIAALAGVVLVFSSGGTATNTSVFNTGLIIGFTVSVVYITVLGILTLLKKKSFVDPLYIICVIGAIVLTMFVGGFLGLIPIAYLTTRKKLS